MYYRVSHGKHAVFGKTQWQTYSLEDLDGRPTAYGEVYRPFLELCKQVHPDLQQRSTGFNCSDRPYNNLYIHTDVDYHLEHPNFYNIIIPVDGESVISYYETRDEEIRMGKPNAHGHDYYHEFRGHKKGHDFNTDFVKERLIGSVNMNKPVLLSTRTMHGVHVETAPRIAFCVRWVNIPEHIDYYTFKNKIEEVLG